MKIGDSAALVDPSSLSLSLRLNCQDYPYVNTFLYYKLRVVVSKTVTIRRLLARKIIVAGCWGVTCRGAVVPGLSQPLADGSDRLQLSRSRRLVAKR